MRSHKRNSFKFLTQVIVALVCILTFANTASAKSWLVHQTNMNMYDKQIADLNDAIHHLIEEKRKTDEPSELRVITQAMADKHKEIQKIDKDRQKEILHMRFQHPEKGESAKREYTRGKIKSLDEMESEFGLDAKLNRIQVRIRKTFGTEKLETEKPDSSKQTDAPLAKNKSEKRQHEFVDERNPASESSKRNRPADADEQIHFSK
jgi:hypothetical protein